MECSKKYSFTELLHIVEELRSEQGCSWDRAQTHESLIPCLKEEALEVIAAIENQDDENLCEELGDVLLQVLMHSEIAKEENRFTLDDVIDGLAAKLVRRHPHVFGDPENRYSGDGVPTWEEIKKLEKEEKARRRK